MPAWFVARLLGQKRLPSIPKLTMLSSCEKSGSTTYPPVVDSRAEEGCAMGGFLFGLIVGVVGTLAFVIYDEGEYFLRLHAGLKRTMERYKQAS
jgi:hypothetical protein